MKPTTMNNKAETINRRPEVAVIVPVFNREKLLLRCLNSVINQTYRPIHLIVVDNNSTDQSHHVAELFADNNSKADFKITVVDEPTPGATPARNRGLQEATSPIISFFDSDDAMRPDMIEEAIMAFDKNKDADIAYWKVMFHSLKGEQFVAPFYKKELFVNHIIHSVLRTQGYAVKAELLKKVEAWNTNLPSWNDWELGIRMLCTMPTAVAINKVLADSYQQEVSITGTSFSSRHGDWEKSIDAAEYAISHSNHPLKYRLRCLMYYRRVVLAAHYYKEGCKNFSATLYKSTMQTFHGSIIQRLALHFSYLYTRCGLRGAFRLVKHFI
jgi:glycosyltransferase involved in cell wall biosynthesis